ncbi:heme ABC exporter ATP-binding protein CcmA [soil metagenome]
MQITLNKIGKKFQHEWVFRNINFQFYLGKSYALVGPNGSGKSTLLQIISGLLLPTEGEVLYQKRGKNIDPDDIFRYVDISAPYQELVEEFTLSEFLDFHFNFKTIKNEISQKEMIYKMHLEKSAHKHIKNFSSGMKQRLKLALSFFSESPVMLLDEPTSNLDEHGINWYMQNIRTNISNKIILISSNQPSEYSFCDHIVNINDFK